MKILKIIRMKIRSKASLFPDLFIPVLKLIYISHNEHIVDLDSDVVIEGFPRSANTFSVIAFLLAQSNTVKIAHHTHSVAQVLWAIRHRIPTIVLIREPLDAISSLVIRSPEIPLSIAFTDYINFYQTLLRYGRNGFVTATFEDVVNDFGKIILITNEKFGTRFLPFIPSQENTQQVFERINEINRRRKENEFKIARPSQLKKQVNERVKEDIKMNYSNKLIEAENVWQQFTSY